MLRDRLLSTLFPYTTLFRSLFNMGEAEWDPVIETHLKGTFTVFRAAAPIFREQKAGTLIGFTSGARSEEHTSELQSLRHLVCRLLLEKKNTYHPNETMP